MAASTERTPKEVFRIKLLRTFAILFVLLAPVGFAVVLRSGEAVYYRMPVIGPRTVSAGDSVYHRLETKGLQGVPGKSLNLSRRQHVILLISPHCDSLLLREALRVLTQAFGYLLDHEDDLRIGVVGLAPADSRVSLHRFFASLPPNQRALTVGIPFQDSLAAFVASQLLEPRYTPEEPCRKLPFRMLLSDAQGHLRAVYPDLRAAYVKRLQEDVRTLRSEQKYPQKWLPSKTHPRTLDDAALE